MAADPGRERADVARSRRRILAAATRMLADDPSPSIAAVAERAGLARTTVYRHFATREQLLEAVEDELIELATRDIDALAREHAGAAEALGAIAAAFVDVRYRVLFEWADRLHVASQRAKRTWDAPLLALIETGQRRGELDAGVRPRVILTALAGLTRRALQAYVDGELSLEEAKLVAGQGLLRGFATTAAGSGT